MAVSDVIILVLALAGGTYGLVRGLRPTLYLLIVFLTSLLAMMYLTMPIERLFLRLSGLGVETYAGAPMVAVFILEGEDVMAYSASLIPLYITILLLILFSVCARFGRKYFTEPSKGTLSRILGLVAGLVSGGALALIFAVQLVRLPRPMAVTMVRDSILLNALNDAVSHLLPTLAGGI